MRRLPMPPVVALACAALLTASSGAQRAPATATPVAEHGAADAWTKLQKLRTTASVMHTTAHPDDEHGGVLARLSRGEGARVSLLTLTRGESGDNALGPELFDALGLIRTEELLLANRYYGVDAQYFTSAVDYGFSKRLDEALEKWGPEDVLGDMVAIIRTERPFVIVSRFQGNARDGHGQHQAAGLLTKQAFEAAGDPWRFPEQIAAGLRPWQPLKLYMGGVRESEDWTLRVDAGQYDPVVGETYATLGRLGLAVQRSQTAGRFNPDPGPALSYYRRLGSTVVAPEKEDAFFDGMDTSLAGLYRTLGREAPPAAERLLTAISREIAAAVDAFSFTNPSAAAPALARALDATRTARRELSGDPDVAHALEVKVQQIADAIHAALGIRLTAVAQAAGTPEATGPFAAGPPPMGPVVPGQSFEVRAAFTHRGADAVQALSLVLADNDGAADWDLAPATPEEPAAPDRPVVRTLAVTVPPNATLTRPYFSRTSIQDARYSFDRAAPPFRPFAPPPLEVVARYSVGAVAIEMRRPVTRLESQLPYGHDTRLLSVVPAISVALDPAHAIARVGERPATVRLTAEVVSSADGMSEGTLRLEVPTGWTATPATFPFAFARAGERDQFTFEVRIPSPDEQGHRVEAVARAGDREYREGYTAIRHRDLETRHLYRDAAASIRGVDVQLASGLTVGYVMGIGDEVPAGLAQLGVDVRLLGAQDLATADLRGFDAIITGTRAYAVRDDLRTHNRRLLEYVHDGGNLVVLYNTQELVPDEHAPYPGQLPRNAEEVSEEDSPVELLAPDHPVFTTPNRITQADFAGWVEQRGSKFWSAWDPRYAALIATWDTDQPPQRGGWLYARYGKGHYTYFAYALHRQLPYGVPGAYRLLANLLSMGRSPD
jgi:LmbE family N-acetylglucosaminyl deacetylase